MCPFSRVGTINHQQVKDPAAFAAAVMPALRRLPAPKLAALAALQDGAALEAAVSSARGVAGDTAALKRVAEALAGDVAGTVKQIKGQ